MRAHLPRSQRPRRGFTLLEMLVVVALVVLMMTILVQIFQAATGAMSTSRAYQELDQKLRMVDATVRRDLTNLTARMIPPGKPTDGNGYFEYIENAFADLQGEDSDDVLRMTVDASDGQPFVGRMVIRSWVNPTPGVPGNARWPLSNNLVGELVTITSDKAEVIYFLRDGNLYRRVLLISPERQGAVSFGTATVGGISLGGYSPNDLLLSNQLLPGASIGWLGYNDLSARPNMSPLAAGFSRGPILNTLGDLTNRENRCFSPRFCDDFGPLDGNPDDNNNDGINDYYPTLYPNAFTAGLVNYAGTAPSSPPFITTSDVMAFPFIYRGMYSKPAFPSVHVLDPSGNSFNHAPLQIGDSIAIPDVTNPTALQTWWGFPTWKETCSVFWGDPVNRINIDNGGSQAFVLTYGGTFVPLPQKNVPFGSDNLPEDTDPFTDGTGTAPTRFFPPAAVADPALIWKDDLLLANVRSFDVKAYDANVWIFDKNLKTYRSTGEGYVDLGYLDDPLVQFGFTLNSFNKAVDGYGTFGSAPLAQLFLNGFGHEGRIPPVPVVNGVGDYRFNPQPQFQSQDVGDNQASTLRLMRTYDTWSSTYTSAPTYAPNDVISGQAFGTGKALYPSFPAPYPAQLRGLQIQIRVVDPSNQHIKTLTIRQDLSDKV